MKKLFILLILFVLVSGCVQQQAYGTSRYVSADLSSMEEFSVEYPEWEERENDDPVNIITMARGDEVCNFFLNAPEAPMNWYEEALKTYITDNNGVILSESPIVYKITTDEGYTFLAKTRGLFCEDRGYFLIFACLEGNFDQELFDRISGSMSCEKSWTVPKRTSKKLGMVISPANTTTAYSDFANAFNIARNSGIQVTHYYTAWGSIEKSKDEYDWIGTDFIMNFIRNKGLEVSQVFNIIHTSVVGELPDDITFKRFDDPEFMERFTSFVLEYIERYRDVISYVEIGNEVDIYLHSHPYELRSFKNLYRHVYDSINEKYPDLPVGTVFAYHEIKTNNAQWIYHNLTIGDFDAFTLYVYTRPDFIFDRDPEEMTQHLKEIEALTGERSFALEEFGWSTSSRLQGREEDQRQAVIEFFNYLESAPERLHFMNFFILHDGIEKDCVEQAKSFLEEDSPMLENKEFMDIFSDFLCQLGLIKNDGTEKLAWNEWLERAKAYKETQEF